MGAPLLSFGCDDGAGMVPGRRARDWMIQVAQIQTRDQRASADPMVLPGRADGRSRAPFQRSTQYTRVIAASGSANGSGVVTVDIQSRFGRRLRQLRTERNWTQLRMAVDFGIDRGFISEVERGHRAVTLRMLEVLAVGLGMSLSDLLKDV